MNVVNSMAELQLRERARVTVAMKMLALAVSGKALEMVTQVPDWSDCLHVDVVADAEWRPDLSVLEPMLHTLTTVAAARGKTPVDLCVVRQTGVFSIVIRTENVKA